MPVVVFNALLVSGTPFRFTYIPSLWLMQPVGEKPSLHIDIPPPLPPLAMNGRLSLAESSAIDSDHRFSFLVIGQGGVGKSAFTIRCTHDEFVAEYDPTIGARAL